ITLEKKRKLPTSREPRSDAPQRKIADRVRSYGSRKHGRRSGLRPRLDSPAPPDASVARTEADNRERLCTLRARSIRMTPDFPAAQDSPLSLWERVGVRGS